MGHSMNPRFRGTGRIYVEKVFSILKVQMSSFKVWILAFKVQTLSAIQISVLRGSGTLEPKINAHHRTFDLTNCVRTEVTDGAKIRADPEKCSQELISEKLLILLRDRPCLELFLFPVIFRLCASCRTNYWNQSESY